MTSKASVIDAAANTVTLCCAIAGIETRRERQTSNLDSMN
ncbi:hypothetical protein JCM19233_5293 [Vibrio astriarenae]|nr:hypothetical protein JCM19233_5293 [Vibrio sp. C7]